jgi:hypothetical protein
MSDWAATVRRLEGRVTDPELRTALTEYGTELEHGIQAANIPGDIATLLYGEPGLEAKFRDIEELCRT